MFDLFPLDFEFYVTQSFEGLGKPEVNFKTSWNVYCNLWDPVETAVPGVMVGTFSESIMDNGGDVPEFFALAHLKKPNLEGVELDEDDVGSKSEVSKNVVGENEVGEGRDDKGEIFCVEFTNEEDRDELY